MQKDRLQRKLDDYNKQLIELEAEKEQPIKPVCEYHTNYPKEWANVLKDNKAAEKIRKNRINCLKGILEGKRDKIQAELDKLNKSDKDR